MSRIGKIPVELPNGVQVTVNGSFVEIKGTKGTLSREIDKDLKVEVNDKNIVLSPTIEKDNIKAMWGLYRVLLNNMVIGVSVGYKKELEIVGVGYKAEMKGNDVKLIVGHSSPVLYKAPEGISISVENQIKIKIEGIDKEKVGQTAAEIRKVRPPEPYKGKGIRYLGEQIRRKVGKTAGK